MLSCLFKSKMSTAVLTRVYNHAEILEKKLSQLKDKLHEVKRAKIEETIRKLTRENEVLLNKVETAKAELIRLETLNGKKQIPIPGKVVCSVAPVALPESPAKTDTQEQVHKKDKDSKKSKEKVSTGPQTADVTVDVRKLDFRIGKIVEINKHPDADALYVEKIDCGEDKPRTVVSGLVNHVPIQEMRERMVMVLCNLKPAKMRGITSEAMVMCASSPDKVEVLIPPSGAAPGDLVSCEGYPREPEPQLNPKKKIFETCAPDLKTNNSKIACYKDSPLVVPGKGPVVAPTLKGVQVK